MKKNDWSTVISESSKALELDAKNTKSLLRRATARNAQRDYDRAIEDAEKGLKLTEDVAVQQEFKR